MYTGRAGAAAAVYRRGSASALFQAQRGRRRVAASPTLFNEGGRGTASGGGAGAWLAFAR